MNKIGLIFFICIYVMMSIFAWADGISSETQMIWCVAGIMLVGIPHGAIDHIIYLEERKDTGQIFFYSFYFGLMGIYILAWFLFPVLSFIAFLLLSAYHFGESQFSDIKTIPKYMHILINLMWGCSILSGLIFYNTEELILFSQTAEGLSAFNVSFHAAFHQLFLPLSTLFTIVILTVMAHYKYVEPERLLREVYILALIHFCFYAMPFMIGFSLYFVVLHSFRVLTEEFEYLRSKRINFSVSHFIKLLLPFTLTSFIGTAFILYLAHLGYIRVPSVLLVLIFISILTLPHSVVMNGFYDKKGAGNESPTP